MKNHTHVLVILVILIVFMVFPVMADAPPDPGGDPNTGGGTPVGGSPIGSGLLTLLLYGMIYGFRKMLLFFRKGN
ncbi:MAG: hypothetical protein KQI35_04760 [Bacteroidetes bacterium]|nr:hypothetical protein [Bacteroidota bacterium]